MQDWLAARARTSPGRTALIFDGQALTFAMLNQQVTRMCAKCSAAGIERGQKVGLLAFSHPLVVVQILTAMRFGVVLVALNVRLTPAELHGLLRQSDCDWLLPYGDAGVLRELRERGHKVASIDAQNVRGDRVWRSAEVVLDNPAAIIHTSGTSGTPKGAVLTYGNFFYNAMASAYHLGHRHDDYWLCVLPLYHVGGLSMLTKGILHGVTVELHERFDLDAVNHALDTQPITLISLVPTMLYRLLESRTHWPESLRLILLGGAAASPELLARCREIGLPVATTYGLTEAASQVATMLPEDVQRKPGSVGKPLLFTNVKIVGEDGEPAAPGEYGEIVVSGPTVMQGYYNDPEATAKTLRNGELYTGDIGYVDEDGDLFVVQRRSDLIVTGGENVYPAEVEHALRQHPSVKEAVVVGVPDAEWGQQVAAAIKLNDDVSLTEDDLIAYCREYLAGYKLPRRLLFVDSLPQTGSGKIQRKAVVELFMSVN